MFRADEETEEKEEKKAPEPQSSEIAKALYKSRTVLIFGEVDMKMAERVTAQLLAYAESEGDIRVIVNQNDFLLEDEDLAWLHATFGAEQLTVFDKGGHLGNLSNPTVQKSILAALTPMLPPAIKSK